MLRYNSSMRKILKKKYSGVSLVEMLLTMIILTIVMILVGVTLNTMIRASIMSNGRTTARQESEFMLELMRKTIRNSNSEEVLVYTVSGRTYNPTTLRTQDSNLSGYDGVTPVDGSGTEIHFRPIGYDKWVCVGYFPDSTDSSKGYVLKSIRQDLLTPSECFNGQSSQFVANTLVLNSEDIDVNQLSIRYFNTYDSNYLITIDLAVEPTKWVPGSNNISPVFFQQTVVSTQKLTWED